MNKMLYVLNVANRVNNFSEASMLAAKELGIEFHIAGNWGYKNENEKIFDEEKLGIKIHQIDFQRNPLHPINIKAFKQLKKLVELEKFDVIHCNTPTGGVLGRLCAKKYGIFCIYQAHGFHFFKGASKLNWMIYYPIERLLARLTNILITINEEDYEISRKFSLRHNGMKIKVSGVGIKLSNQKESIDRNLYRAELGLNSSDIVIISMGDLIKRKNYENAIDAINKINNKKVHYLICGTGPNLEKLKKISKKYNLEDNIHFLGFRNDIDNLLYISDIFLLSSFQEGLPRSTMEAMAKGLPVACSNIRGNRDLVENNKSGVLFDPHNSTDIANKLNRLLKSNLNEIGLYNKSKIRSFSLNEVKKEMEGIYRNIEMNWRINK